MTLRPPSPGSSSDGRTTASYYGNARPVSPTTIDTLPPIPPPLVQIRVDSIPPLPLPRVDSFEERVALGRAGHHHGSTFPGAVVRQRQVLVAVVAFTVTLVIGIAIAFDFL